MNITQMPRIEGDVLCSANQRKEPRGMPTEETEERIRAWACMVLRNELPGFQIGPEIGRSSLGTAAVLRVLTEEVRKAEQLNGDGHFAFTDQSGGPYRGANGLALDIQAPIDFRDMGAAGHPHVDSNMQGLAVHRQFGSEHGADVERKMWLSYLRSDLPPIEEGKDEHLSFKDWQDYYKGKYGEKQYPTPDARALGYRKNGLEDPFVKDKIQDVHMGTTSPGVLTIFSEGNLKLKDGSELQRAVHCFGSNQKGAGKTIWTRYGSNIEKCRGSSSLRPNADPLAHETVFWPAKLHLDSVSEYMVLRGKLFSRYSEEPEMLERFSEVVEYKREEELEAALLWFKDMPENELLQIRRYIDNAGRNLVFDRASGSNSEDQVYFYEPWDLELDMPFGRRRKELNERNNSAMPPPVNYVPPPGLERYFSP